MSVNFVTGLPAAFLRDGIFDPKWSREAGLKYLNYASLGFLIGHEISHGFDNIGSQFDEEGNFKNWWSNETLEKFQSNIDCFVAQYDNFTDPVTGMNLNGSTTLTENIADNGEEDF